MPSDAEIDALIERLNVLCNPLSEMLPERERLTAFVRDGDEAARFLAALRDERDRLKSGNRYAQLEQQARARVRELEQKLERARVALTDVTACVENRKAIYEALLEKASVWAEPEYMRWDMLKYVVEAFEILEKEISPARATLAEIGQRE